MSLMFKANLIYTTPVIQRPWKPAIFHTLSVSSKLYYKHLFTFRCPKSLADKTLFPKGQ